MRSKTYYRVRSIARFITGITIILTFFIGADLFAQILIHWATGK